METKLITKTIKELADEYDGNVDQLHRTIARRDAQILRLQEDNEALNWHVDYQRWEIERAEKKSDVSSYTMIICLIITLVFTGYTAIFIW